MQEALARKYPEDEAESSDSELDGCILDKPEAKQRKGFTIPLEHGKKAFTILTTKWEEVPASLRDRLVLRPSKRGGYLNVSKQPGSGNGFQVQIWQKEKKRHIRLATVEDEKVGALLCAAAEADPSLAEYSLKCKAWFDRMLSDSKELVAWEASLQHGSGHVTHSGQSRAVY